MIFAHKNTNFNNNTDILYKGIFAGCTKTSGAVKMFYRKNIWTAMTVQKTRIIKK
jgi:hypothetical protein